MANFTEQAIKQTFMNMLNDKPLSKITVKDIAAECGINRNSFYYHYNDIPDLLETILTEETGRIVRSETRTGTLYEHILYAVDFAIENKIAVYHIYNSANREIFEQYLGRISYKAVRDFMDTTKKTANISAQDKEVIIHYYKCLLVGFVIDWLASGMNYDLRKKLERICLLFDGAMENAIKICEKEFENNNKN